MTNDYWNHVARKPRHKAAGSPGLRVCVKRNAAVTSAPHEAELLDLSRSGVLLRLPMSFSIDEPIVVCLEDKASHIDLALSAMVRWCRSEEDGQWLIGCESDHPLEWETLGELFLSDVLMADD
ncbi:MAG TPA: PilZ domain-containing protein [Thermoguttaceae bacterium]|nr:PilZ domain-containing protein [Thermoguttaceae bacterium]